MESSFLAQLTNDPVMVGTAYSDWLEESGRLEEAEFVRHVLDLRSEKPSPRMVWCPPGSFVMGSASGEPGRWDDEEQVFATIPYGFWMGKYQVTQAEWQKLSGDNPSNFRPNGMCKNLVRNCDTTQFPVECVSWKDCMTFCKKLAKQEREAGRLPDNWVFRLPTEAEWEYACRAGTTTAFAFGDQLDGTQANFCGAKKLPTPTPVGSYPANAWGLHDMHGNVWEWCLDHYQANLFPPDYATGKFWVTRSLRGGSFRCHGIDCRSGRRNCAGPNLTVNFVGFRYVVAPARRRPLIMEIPF